MQYTIEKKTDWGSVPIAKIENVCWGYDQPDIHAFAQLCYDDDFLYVKLTAKEKDIRSVERGPLAMPCRDSCLEFFVSPMSDGRYFNIEFNPDGGCFFGFGSGPNRLFRLLNEVPEKNILCPKAERTMDGWAISYALPFEYIRLFFPEFTVKPGVVMKGNFYKCGDLTVKVHCLSWNPMTIDHPIFHYPPDFGTLVFA